MRDFSRSGGRLRALPFQARLVYSVFLAFTLAALALTAWLGANMLGSDLSGAREYYAGGVERAPASAPTAGGDAHGPTLDLPDAALPPATRDAMPVRKLLEVTHFHLFSMPVYLLILSHLFMLSTLSARAKTSWIALASVAVALHIAAPWLVRSAAAGSVAIYSVSGSLLAITFVVMSAVPLLEMWRTPAA